jgi:hypothetical protein
MAATLDGFVNELDAVFEAKFMLPWSFSEEAAAGKKAHGPAAAQHVGGPLFSPSSSRRTHFAAWSQKLGQAHDIVGCNGEDEDGADLGEAAHFHLCEPADSLAPAEARILVRQQSELRPVTLEVDRDEVTVWVPLAGRHALRQRF